MAKNKTKPFKYINYENKQNVATFSLSANHSFQLLRIEEKTLLEESERSLGSNAATSADALALATTPPLHVGGKFLKDPCGNNVVLHGVAITPSPWFNGCQYGSSSGYCTWDNYNVQGALNYNKSVMDKLSSSADGWYLNYIRLHIDPYWTNDPGPAIPENDISRFNYNRLVTYTDQVIIPLINHARSRGMYVILRPPGVCPSRIAVNDAYHSYLKRVWTFLSQHPGLKNADNVMFELANEPVEILGTNGTWGTTGTSILQRLKFLPATG
jgi:hypothetical protein